MSGFSRHPPSRSPEEDSSGGRRIRGEQPSTELGKIEGCFPEATLVSLGVAGSRFLELNHPSGSIYRYIDHPFYLFLFMYLFVVYILIALLQSCSLYLC